MKTQVVLGPQGNNAASITAALEAATASGSWSVLNTFGYSIIRDSDQNRCLCSYQYVDIFEGKNRTWHAWKPARSNVDQRISQSELHDICWGLKPWNNKDAHTYKNGKVCGKFFYGDKP